MVPTVLSRHAQLLVTLLLVFNLVALSIVRVGLVSELHVGFDDGPDFVSTPENPGPAGGPGTFRKGCAMVVRVAAVPLLLHVCAVAAACITPQHVHARVRLLRVTCQTRTHVFKIRLPSDTTVSEPENNVHGGGPEDMQEYVRG